jgi:hypothetical protein
VVAKTLVNVHVPLLFNGTELEKSNNKGERITIDRLWRDYIHPKKIDVRPPYQRHEAWAVKDEKLFLASCFSGFMPLGNLHLCKKGNRPPQSNSFYAVDGRQRVTALDNFFNDKFAVEVVFTYSDGSTVKRRMLWSEIVSDEDCFDLKETLLKNEISIVVYEAVSLETQRKIFIAVNSGKPLNAEEVLYCNYFLARRVLNHLFDDIFAALKDICQNSVRHRIRFADVKMTHELLLLCCGPDFKQKPEARKLRAKDRTPSAKLIHDRIDQMSFEYEEKIEKSHLDAINVTDKLPIIKEIAALLFDVFQTHATLGRIDGKGNLQNYVLARNLTDVMGFLYKVIIEKKTTIAKLQKKKTALANGLADYYKEKPEHYANQSTSDLPTMSRKYTLMERHLNAAF